MESTAICVYYAHDVSRVTRRHAYLCMHVMHERRRRCDADGGAGLGTLPLEAEGSLVSVYSMGLSAHSEVTLQSAMPMSNVRCRWRNDAAN